MPIARSESQRERDRAIVSDLYLQGWNQQEIADKLGIHRNTVGADIKALLKEWKKNRNGLVDEFEGKYRLIFREAYLAWLHSKDDAETTTQEAIEGDAANGKQRLKVSTRREGQSGNPALLAQAQAALKAIREMFGVDAQKTGTDDSPFVIMVKYGERSNGTASPATPETSSGD